MLTTTAFAATAALIGDPTRANILAALMDGRALTAKELAETAGVTPQTASDHLAQLTTAGLLAMTRQGRHRYHRLASPAVAQMLETIMAVAATPPETQATTQSTPQASTDPGRQTAPTPRPTPRIGPKDAALRRARTCYDHLAGQLAVAIADRMSERGHLDLSPDGAALTKEGATFLRTLGVDSQPPTQAKPGRHPPIFCRPCLDWSERRPHLAGTLGTALCTTCLTQGWLRRTEGTRALTITPKGRTTLGKAFDLHDAFG